mgnify:CR=1 FL=1
MHETRVICPRGAVPAPMVIKRERELIDIRDKEDTNMYYPTYNKHVECTKERNNINGVATLNYGVLGTLLSAIINMVHCAAFILVMCCTCLSRALCNR